MENDKYYKLLGIAEGASQEAIKIAYDKILIRARYDKAIDVMAINEAYGILSGNAPKEQSESENKKETVKKKISEKSSFMILGGIILLIILAIVVPNLIKNRPGLSIVYVGNYVLTEKYAILEETLEKTDGIKNVSVTSVFLNAGAASGEADMAGRITLAGILQSGEADLLITTREGFDYLMTDSHAIKTITTHLLTELALDPNDSRMVYDESGTSIYGIDLSANKMLSSVATGNDEKILTISQKTENYDIVIMTIRAVLMAD